MIKELTTAIAWRSARFMRRFSSAKRQSVVAYVAKCVAIPLRNAYYYSEGINRYKNSNETGEAFFYDNILPLLLGETKDHCLHVFFDVGANVGDLSVIMHQQYPMVDIYAFEPNADSYHELKRRTAESERIQCFNMALGATCGREMMYIKSGDPYTQHATLLADVFEEIHHVTKQDQNEILVDVQTIDEICHTQNVSKIDFIKIDVEGYELNVLRGAKELLEKQAVSVILFEFNSMNVISRVFLRDYYQLLKGFSFYRLHPSGIKPLRAYRPSHEVFEFQNIVAIDDKHCAEAKFKKFLV